MARGSWVRFTCHTCCDTAAVWVAEGVPQPKTDDEKDTVLAVYRTVHEIREHAELIVEVA
jgi:hypothetical protein